MLHHTLAKKHIYTCNIFDSPELLKVTILTYYAGIT